MMRSGGEVQKKERVGMQVAIIRRRRNMRAKIGGFKVLAPNVSPLSIVFSKNIFLDTSF